MFDNLLLRSIKHTLPVMLSVTGGFIVDNFSVNFPRQKLAIRCRSRRGVDLPAELLAILRPFSENYFFTETETINSQIRQHFLCTIFHFR